MFNSVRENTCFFPVKEGTIHKIKQNQFFNPTVTPFLWPLCASQAIHTIKDNQKSLQNPTALSSYQVKWAFSISWSARAKHGANWETAGNCNIRELKA